MTGQPKDPNQTEGQESNAPQAEENQASTYTAAQLRMARRKARRLGLNPSNGRQAIEMLEERGISIEDKEPNLTDNQQPGGNAEFSAESMPQANPQQRPIDKNAGKGQELGNALMTQKNAGKVPASEVLGAQPPALISKEQRQQEIAKLEKKIRKRRESRMRRMIRRFSLFVILPTVLMGIYYYKIATPLYGANTEMHVQQASAASIGGMQSLLQGTPFASQSEAIAVQGYLQSREAYTRLQKDYPFVELFMGDNVDRFLRVDEDATDEERFKLYSKQVEVSYDNTDQLIRLEVRTPESESAVDVSQLLLKYAEEQVDEQTQRLRDTGVTDAEKIVDEKLQKLDEAQAKIFDIQEEQGTLSPTADKENLVMQISTLKQERLTRMRTLQQLLSNPNPNQPRVNAERAEIKRIDSLVDELTNEGTSVDESGTSITRLDQEMQLAQMRLGFAQQEFEMAALNLQNAESEARSQRRFIVASLPPTATFAPIYPKKFTSTLSAFIVFFALYILISITIEVIREQVSA